MQPPEPTPPPGLREIQLRFARALLASCGVDKPDAYLLGGDLVSDRPVGPAVGLSVHAGGYPARIHDALVEAFPAVAHFVGEAEFVRLVSRFASVTPPTRYNLNEAGAGFAAFLEADSADRRLGFLPDLARLEWRIVVAFHARRLPSADPSRLADLARAGEQACASGAIALQPGTGLVRSKWPILSLWQLRETPRSEISLAVEGRPERVLVWREGETVKLDLVDDDEASVITGLLEETTFVRLLDRLSVSGLPDDAILSAFARCARLGLLAAPE
jgi:hypothetical protein